jgi:hypothetical protein
VLMQVLAMNTQEARAAKALFDVSGRLARGRPAPVARSIEHDSTLRRSVLPNRNG